MSEVLELTICSSLDKQHINLVLKQHQRTTAIKKHIKYTLLGLSIARKNKMLNRIELTSDISKHLSTFPLGKLLTSQSRQWSLLLARRLS